MQPTLIDVAIGLALLLSVLGACHRGIGREMLHTVMFAILVAVGYVLFKNQSDASAPGDTVFWVVNSSYYLITAYVLTWVGMKVLSPLMIGYEVVGLRSRFWAGILCIIKLAVVLFGLNLWFAVHSTEVHPQRLKNLPPILRESLLVQISDKFTEDLYHWLASKQILEYHKVLDKPKTEKDKRDEDLMKTLGIKPEDAAPVAPTSVNSN